MHIKSKKNMQLNNYIFKIGSYFNFILAGVVGITLLYVFNAHINFYVNLMLFTIQSINLFFIHNFC